MARVIDLSHVPQDTDVFSVLSSHADVEEVVRNFGGTISHIEWDGGSWATVEMTCGIWLTIPKAAIKRRV